MDDKTSKEFRDESKRITHELDGAFESYNDSYSGSIVLKLSQVTKDNNVWSRAGTGVSADVQIIFKANANILTLGVTAKLEEAGKCGGCLLKGSTFLAWKLSLVIVGSVLGALLLITLIVLIVVAVRSPKKKSSKKSKKADTGNSYVSQLPVKAPLGANSHVAPANGLGNGQSAFGNAGMPRIPRATTTSSWDGRTNLEMTPSNSRQNLIPAGRNSRFYEDNEDQYAQSRQSSLYARPQNDPYSQSRPQNNPYSQSRPQNNPYAQSQGHSSPYMH
ncbi:Mucin-13 [Dissostichus eleginoides]|uniref:Mucin-13 n=1 Tax=Dissostichus eleginoides TaxID=100907 RepID=A0AAD9EWS1_DISEL|nr:Mucin-13 [Dissostichus eleginoides]